MARSLFLALQVAALAVVVVVVPCVLVVYETGVGAGGALSGSSFLDWWDPCRGGAVGNKVSELEGAVGSKVSESEGGVRCGVMLVHFKVGGQGQRTLLVLDSIKGADFGK